MIPEPSLSGGAGGGGATTTSYDVDSAREEFARSLSNGETKLYHATTTAADFLLRCEHDALPPKAMKRLALAVRAVEGYGKALEGIHGLDVERMDDLWGAMAITVKAAAGTDFMVKLTVHIATMADNLARLVLYGRLCPTHRPLQFAAAAAYVHTLEFCSAARAVFSASEPSQGDKCDGIVVRWSQFEDRVPDIVDGIRAAIDAIEREGAETAEEKQEREDTVAPLRTEDGKSDRSGGDIERTDNIDAESEQVLEWLLEGTGNPTLHHQAATKLRYPGSGEWLLHSKEYVEWLRTQHAVLWLHGIPGSGKTVLCSTVIEDITQKLRPNGSGVAFFYCSHNDVSPQGCARIFRSIISQLCHQSEQFLAEVKSVYRRFEPQELSVSEAINILKTNSWHFTKIAIVVDALDECPDHEETIHALVELIDRQCGNISLFLTSRQEENIQQFMSRHAQFDVPISKTGVQKDINTFVWAKLQQRVASHRLKLRDPTLLETIRQTLVDNADGMFLWAICQIESICRQRNDKAIRTALGKLPRDLDQTYIRILEEVRMQGPEEKKLVRRVLRWLVYSRMPLHPEELAELVAVEPKDSVLDSSAVHTDPEDLLAACRCLIRTVRDENGVERVQLIHSTVHEFLISERIKSSTISEFHMSPTDSHQTLATICLRYLGFTDFSSRCKTDAELHRRLRIYHALGYVASHWHDHLYQCCDQGTFMQLLPALNWFLNQREDNYTSWLQAVSMSAKDYGENTPPLYFTVLYSLYPLTLYLLDRGDNPNARNTSTEGDCALHVAAYHNDLPTIRVLAAKGADIEARAWNREQTPLHYAAEAGSYEAVTLLLDLGADVDSRSHSQSTPLYRAARGGDILTVEELLKRGADVNAKTWDGFTPAHEAARNGDSKVWKALVAAGADMEAETSTGQKPGDVASTMMQPLLKVMKDFECAHPGCKLVFPTKSEKAAHEQTTHLSQLPTYSPPALVPTSNSSPSPSSNTPIHSLSPSITATKPPVRSASNASKNSNRHRTTQSVTPLPPPIKHNDNPQPINPSMPRPAAQYFWCSAASCSHLFDSMASRDHHEATAHAGMTVTFKHQASPVPPASTRPLPIARTSTTKTPPNQTYKRSLSDERLNGLTSTYGKNRTYSTAFRTSSTSSSQSNATTRSGSTTPTPNAVKNSEENLEICGIVGCLQRFNGIGELMRHEVNAHQEALHDLENEAEGVEGDVIRLGKAASVVYSCRSPTCPKRFQLVASRMWHEMLTHPSEDLVKRNERAAHTLHYGDDKVWTDMFNEWKRRRNGGT